MEKKVFEDVKITVLKYRANVLMLTDAEYEGPPMRGFPDDLLE